MKPYSYSSVTTPTFFRQTMVKGDILTLFEISIKRKTLENNLKQNKNIAIWQVVGLGKKSPSPYMQKIVSVYEWPLWNLMNF
jgi:hypothetical protein